MFALMYCVVVILISLNVTLSTPTTVSADYWGERAKFIEDEASYHLGSKINLSSSENVVNSILMDAKRQEIFKGFKTQLFPPARHFFDAKADIEESNVFRIIKNLPKGALLHGHDTGMISLDYLVRNLTHRNNLYACIEHYDENPVNILPFSIKKFKFSLDPPNSNQVQCVWTLIETLRTFYGSQVIDDWLYKELSLITLNPREKYPNTDAVWDAFSSIFLKVDGLITYKPVFKDYYKQVLKELKNDNVMYLELRGTLPMVYDIEGTSWEGGEVLAIYKDATNEFLIENPDFFGARYIYAPLRHVNNSVFAEYISLVTDLHRKFPKFLAGFDLVGQEDKGRPLSDFAAGIISLPTSLKLFFHAGETNWQGLTDLNLVDAILLNTTRIGHGYAINKHPLVKEEVKKKKIGLEVNPISNQVLMLVDDLRNHPMGGLLADDFPIVISSDDPTFWNASGLSYDFYEAFMGLAGMDADLRFLKQLSLNSILYSSMQDSEKEKAINSWEEKWHQFIQHTILEYSHRLSTNLL